MLQGQQFVITRTLNIQCHFLLLRFISYTQKTDIYSLGVIVCELATNAHPEQLHLAPPQMTTGDVPREALLRWNGLSQRLREFIQLLLTAVCSAP
jgi:serine/threonine protein kinase